MGMKLQALQHLRFINNEHTEDQGHIHIIYSETCGGEQ